MGLFQSPNTSAIMGTVAPARLGIASGMLATSRSSGQVMGVAFAAVIFAARVPLYVTRLTPTFGEASATRSAFVHAAHDAAWVLTGFAVLGAILSLVRGGPEVTGLACEPVADSARPAKAGNV